MGSRDLIQEMEKISPSAEECCTRAFYMYSKNVFGLPLRLLVNSKCFKMPFHSDVFFLRLVIFFIQKCDGRVFGNTIED